MYLTTGYMVLIPGLEGLLGWERLPLFDHFSYVEMIVFNDKADHL
jgi:hypothetical protein